MSIEEKYDEVRQLINVGKEKGYLLYDEVNEMLPSEITSAEDLDELFNAFGSAGIEIVDCFNYLPLRIHYKRTIRCNRFGNRFTT